MTVDVHLAVPAANGLGMRNVLYLWSLANPAQKRLVGTLRLLAATGTQANGVSLTYAPGWLTNGFALSEDLPLQPGERIPTERDSAVGAVDSLNHAVDGVLARRQRPKIRCRDEHRVRRDRDEDEVWFHGHPPSVTCSVPSVWKPRPWPWSAMRIAVQETAPSLWGWQ